MRFMYGSAFHPVMGRGFQASALERVVPHITQQGTCVCTCGIHVCGFFLICIGYQEFWYVCFFFWHELAHDHEDQYGSDDTPDQRPGIK